MSWMNHRKPEPPAKTADQSREATQLARELFIEGMRERFGDGRESLSKPEMQRMADTCFAAARVFLDRAEDDTDA